MKRIFSIIAILVVCSASSQDTISVSEWQEDLRFLQKKVNEQYPFLFKKVSEKEFNDAVESFYQNIPNMEQHEIVVGFSRIIALFKYGHTRMAYSDAPVPFHSIQVEFYRFKDGLYIKSTHKNHKDLVGAKVIAIAGVPIDEAIKKVYPTVPVENAMFFDAYGLDHLTIPEVLHAQGVTSKLNLEVTLTLEKDGKAFEKTITATTALWPPMHYGQVRPDSDWVNQRDKSFTPNYLKHLDRTYYLEYLKESKTVYVRHSRIRNDKKEPVKDFYNRVFEFIDNNEVEKFVMDLRLNGGGNNFLNKPIITGIIANKKINQPGRFFVITGRRTFSAAQSLINELDNYANVLFVGEPSSENINFYGDNKRVVLPNSKLPVYLSFAWWQDKPQWQNADFIKPDYPVDMTYGEYIANEDPILDVVLNFNSQNFTMEPMEYLTGLMNNGDFQKAKTEAKRMAKDPAYSFVDFERKISSKAMIKLGNDNKKALFLYELVTKLFPKSQSAWGNFGQAQWETGNMEGAKSSYEQVLSIAKEGGEANNAKRMLQKILEKE